MARAAEKRKRLFDLYAANLKFIHPDAPDVIGCPICHCTLTRDDLVGRNPKVTLAHVDPRSIGGKTVCLSCVVCNNRIGSRFEASLTQERRLSDWWKGKQSLRVRGHGTDSGIALELSFSPGRGSLDVREVPMHTDPKKWQDLIAHPPTKECPLLFDIPFPDHADLLTASIHSAYLHLFYHFGYEYALHENTEQIRNLLLERTRPGEFRNAVRLSGRPPGAPEGFVEGVNILIEPSGFACFLVFRPLINSPGWFRCIAMPGFRPNGRSGYLEMLKRGNDLREYRAVTLVDLPPLEDRLTDRKYRGLGHMRWDRAFSGPTSREVALP